MQQTTTWGCSQPPPFTVPPIRRLWCSKSSPQLDPAALTDVAAFYPTVVAQRAGHLIDFMSNEENLPINTDPLHTALMQDRFRYLSPGSGTGERDNRWRLIVNIEVEHDL